MAEWKVAWIRIPVQQSRGLSRRSDPVPKDISNGAATTVITQRNKVPIYADCARMPGSASGAGARPASSSVSSAPPWSHVDHLAAATPIGGPVVETLYNPVYAPSDNLATCWVARHRMHRDFVLLNGDTIFEDRVLHRLLEGVSAAVTVKTDHKNSYDDGDMKVSVDEEGRLLAIGKMLKPEIVNRESI